MVDPTKIALKVLAIIDQAHIDDREPVGRALPEMLVENLEKHLTSRRFIFRHCMLLREGGGIELNYNGDEYFRSYFNYTIHILVYGLVDINHRICRIDRGLRCNLSGIPLSRGSMLTRSHHRSCGGGRCQRPESYDCSLLIPRQVVFQVYRHP